MPKYETKLQEIEIGSIKLKLNTVADLDQAIDTLWDEKERAHLEHEAMDLCPYYGVIWPSARALAEYLAKMGGWLKGKTFLEVGCGMALPSFVAAKLGAKVTATDFHPDVPQFLRENRALNGIEIQFESLNWQKESDSLGQFDFIVGSDVLYESHHPESLALTAAAHCHKESHILIADPGRAYLQQFSDAIQKQGFRTDTFIRDNIFILSSQKL